MNTWSGLPVLVNVGAGVFTGNQPAFPFFLIILRQVCMVCHLRTVHKHMLCSAFTPYCLLIWNYIFSRLHYSMAEVRRDIATKNQLDEAKSRRWSGTETKHAMCAPGAVYKDLLQKKNVENCRVQPSCLRLWLKFEFPEMQQAVRSMSMQWVSIMQLITPS